MGFPLKIPVSNNPIQPFQAKVRQQAIFSTSSQLTILNHLILRSLAPIPYTEEREEVGNKVNYSLRKLKSDYYTLKIEENKNNLRNTSKLLKVLSMKHPNVPLLRK